MLLIEAAEEWPKKPCGSGCVVAEAVIEWAAREIYLVDCFWENIT